MQRLLKDCEEKAEAAKRPSQQQQAPASGAPGASQRRAPGGQTASSGSEEEEGDSDGSGDGAAPASAAPAPAAAPAVLTSSAEEQSSGDDGAGSGEGAFVPNLDRLKKLGKRAGPGERLTSRSGSTWVLACLRVGQQACRPWQLPRAVSPHAACLAPHSCMPYACAPRAVS